MNDALTEFLLARIAEDEAGVDGMYQAEEIGHRLTDEERARAERMTAECEAKRKRIEHLSQWDALCSPDDWPDGDMSGAALADAGRYLLRIESLPYADHTDYRDEWKP